MFARILPGCVFGLALAACSPGNQPAPTPPPAPQPAPTVTITPIQPVAPAKPWKYQDALDRAVAHILESQKAKGDWGTMMRRPMDVMLGSNNSLHVFGNASTALCTYALITQPATPQINEAIRRGLQYLIDAPDTPRATMQVFYNVWAHAYMLECFSAAMRDARFADLREGMRKRSEHELRRLMDHQGLDGGWGYYDFQYATLRPSGDISTSFTTAAALVGIFEARRAGLSVRDHSVEIALAYMERQRFVNGAYFYSTGHQFSPMGHANLPRGSLGRSQSGDNALYTWNRTIAPETLRAQLDYFFKDHAFIEMGRGRQMPHEAWYATAPYYYYFGHYYASRNVLALPADIRPEYADKLADLVVKGQYEDGSFWDYPLYGYAKAYGTGYGVLILANLKQAMTPAQ